MDTSRLVFGGFLLVIGGAGLVEYWVQFHSPRLCRLVRLRGKNSSWQRRSALAIGLLSAYLLTASSAPAIGRHTGDGGCLQWLPSVPGAMICLQAYAWPLAIAARAVPPLRGMVNAAIDAWWGILDPPDTTA